MSTRYTTLYRTALHPPAVDDEVWHACDARILAQLLLHQLLPLAGRVVQHCCSVGTGQAHCLSTGQQEVLVIDVLLLKKRRTAGQRADKQTCLQSWGGTKIEVNTRGISMVAGPTQRHPPHCDVAKGNEESGREALRVFAAALVQLCAWCW